MSHFSTIRSKKKYFRRFYFKTINKWKWERTVKWNVKLMLAAKYQKQRNCFFSIATTGLIHYNSVLRLGGWRHWRKKRTKYKNLLEDFGKLLKFIGLCSSLKHFPAHLLKLWKNWKLTFFTLGCGKFKFQEDGKKGNSQRKENQDLVMANLNLLVFLNLRKYREDQAKNYEDDIQL